MTRALIKQFERHHREMILTPMALKELYGKEDASEYENAVFKVNESGEFQVEFLSVWPVIRDPKLLKMLAQQLASHLLRLRQRTPFNRIVTCSPTMRYVMEEISFLFPEDSADVTFEYLGLHPMQGMDLIASRPFSERDHVAIITDVVSSGALLLEMINVVEAAKAKVVGSLAIFRANYVSDAELAARQRFEPAPENGLSRSNQSNAIFLANLRARDRTSAYSFEIPVDRSTVYPVDEDSADSDFKPHLDFGTILAAQQDCPLLELGTFRSNDKWTSLGIDIEMLLAHLEAPIGDKVLEAFDLEKAPRLRQRGGSISGRMLTIVTTPGRDNRIFSAFLEQQLKKHLYQCRTILIPRSESLSEQYSYFAPERIEFSEDDRVFLCLATVSTSEKLRALAAFLAMSGGRHIKVLTLLNRMNAASGSFLSRVLNLQSGKDRTPKRMSLPLDDPSDFRYSSFFKLHDLSTQDLVRARQLAVQVIENYARDTESVFYETQSRNELKYFEPLPGPRAENERLLDLSCNGDGRLAQDRGDKQLEQSFVAAGIDPSAVPETVAYAMCLRAMQLVGNVPVLSRLMLLPTSKEMTYSLVRLVLLNAAILDVQGFFRSFFNELLNNISDIEDEKRALVESGVKGGALEDPATFHQLRRDLIKLGENQVRCMSILTFISHLRVRSEDRNLAIQVLEKILLVHETEQDALRAFIAASDLLFLWSITFLAHAFDIRNVLDQPAQRFVGALTNQLQGVPFLRGQRTVTDLVTDVFRSMPERDAGLIQETRAYLSDFELFFQEQAVASKPTPLSKLLPRLERSLYPYIHIHHAFNFQRIAEIHSFLATHILAHARGSSTYAIDFSQWDSRDHIKETINRCLIALGDVLRVEPDIGRLIDVRLETDSWATYFNNSYGSSALASDIKALQAILQAIRTDYELWPADLARIKEIGDAIIDHIWRPNSQSECESELYNLVRRHSFRMGDVLEEAILSANKKLSLLRAGAIASERPDTTEHFWTLDPRTCRDLDFVTIGDARDVLEALDNALWNAKHAQEALANVDSRTIECASSPAENGRPCQFVIRITTFGKRFEQLAGDSTRAPTYQDQARKLKMFGGDFTYGQAPGSTPGAQATIKILQSPFRAIPPTDHPWRNTI